MKKSIDTTLPSLRLDISLVERHLVPTRSKAHQLIEEGAVTVNGGVVTKASTKVTSDDSISVQSAMNRYVSRGALKLLQALELFKPQGLRGPQGCQCLDIGASTGGFTQVLLENGADHVISLDVGHGQLADCIKNDQRVTDMNGVNIRDISSSDMPYSPNFIVSDVSFISLKYVFPPVTRIAQSGAECIFLIKPQFEVGKGHLGKNGVVTNQELRQNAIDSVKEAALKLQFDIKAVIDSPITGTHGNHEYLLWMRAPKIVNSAYQI